jgi:wobble nucleotide-excising tRNase
MINKIKLRNIASYKNETVIEDLAKVNFVFGNNGSGKTTIAKFLHDSSLPTEQRDSRFSHCSLEYDANSDSEILVFDDSFVTNNFYNQDSLKGIFSLDKINEDLEQQIISEQNKITADDDRRRDLLQKVATIKESRNQDEFKIKELCWDAKKTFADFYKLKLDGVKNNLFNRLSGIIKSGSELEKPNLIDLRKRYDKFYEHELNKIDLSISVEKLKKITLTEEEVKTLLSDVIVGNKDIDIAELIDKLGISDNWLQKGVEYISDDFPNTCPLCQEQTITDDLKRKFEKYFDQTREEKIKTIQTFADDYCSQSESLLAEIKSVSEIYNEENKVILLWTELNAIVSSNNQKFKEKISSPNEIKMIESIKSFRGKIEEINDYIKLHNSDVGNLKVNQKLVLDHAYLYMAAHVKPQVEKFDTLSATKRKKGYKKHILAEIKTLKIDIAKSKITLLQSQTQNTEKAVEEINNTLRLTGFSGFQIVKESTSNNIDHYYLNREGENSRTHVFKSLSEGEKNFIAFLYFYQMCIGTLDKQSTTKKKIIVIDDPVSSMDSQVLFIVSTYIRKLLARKGKKHESKVFANDSIEQAFILTHNLYFYKEVSFPNRIICQAGAYFRVKKHSSTSSVERVLYDSLSFSDYDYLWKEIKNPQSSNISLLNNLRRILESYLNFTGKADVWESISNIDETHEKYYLYSALLSQMNDGSHKVTITDELYFSKIQSETRENLLAVFESLFKEIGEEHYNMMNSN